MDEINKIRKAFFSNGKSKHSIAKRFSRSWDTVNRIVNMSRDEINRRGKRPKKNFKIATNEVIEAVEAYLQEEIQKGVKKKQRYTAKVIYKELKEQGAYKGSLKTMQNIISSLREKYGQKKAKSFLPLSFPVGSALQIDHGEVDLDIDGKRETGYLFVAGVPGQVLRYCQIFPTKSSEAWGEFHERAFRFFEGSFPKVVYDNDSVLIKKVLGTERKQTNFSLALEEHYDFESHFCNLAAGNEKGSVENAVGYCRRNFLPGLPHFKGWNPVNEYLSNACLKDIQKGVHYKTQEQLSLLFLQTKKATFDLPPAKEWRKELDCRVDSCQLIKVGLHRYSVPERFVGCYVRVLLGISRVRILKNEEVIATHFRRYNGLDSLYLDHYLDQLKNKPSALWDCEATQNHSFHPAFIKMWDSLETKYSSRDASTQFVQILLLGRRYVQEQIVDAIELALEYRAISCSSVENILLQLTTSQIIFDEKAVQELLPKVEIFDWDFDLFPYAELCKEQVL